MKDNCFTVWCWFLPNSMNQPWAYSGLLPLEHLSHLPPHLTPLGCYRAQVWVPWVMQQIPVDYKWFYDLNHCFSSLTLMHLSSGAMASLILQTWDAHSDLRALELLLLLLEPVCPCAFAWHFLISFKFLFKWYTKWNSFSIPSKVVQTCSGVSDSLQPHGL